MTPVGVPMSLSGKTAWSKDKGVLACLHLRGQAALCSLAYTHQALLPRISGGLPGFACSHPVHMGRLSDHACGSESFRLQNSASALPPPGWMNACYGEPCMSQGLEQPWIHQTCQESAHSVLKGKLSGDNTRLSRESDEHPGEGHRSWIPPQALLHPGLHGPGSPHAQSNFAPQLRGLPSFRRLPISFQDTCFQNLSWEQETGRGPVTFPLLLLLLLWGKDRCRIRKLSHAHKKMLSNRAVTCIRHRPGRPFTLQRPSTGLFHFAVEVAGS